MTTFKLLVTCQSHAAQKFIKREILHLALPKFIFWCIIFVSFRKHYKTCSKYHVFKDFLVFRSKFCQKSPFYWSNFTKCETLLWIYLSIYPNFLKTAYFNNFQVLITPKAYLENPKFSLQLLFLQHQGRIEVEGSVRLKRDQELECCHMYSFLFSKFAIFELLNFSFSFFSFHSTSYRFPRNMVLEWNLCVFLKNGSSIEILYSILTFSEVFLKFNFF